MKLVIGCVAILAMAVLPATKLPSGVYFYELQVGESLAETRKMLLVK